MNLNLEEDDRALLLQLLPQEHPLAHTLRVIPQVEARWVALLRRCDRLSKRSRKSAVERLRLDVETFNATLRREHPSLAHEGVYLSTVFQCNLAFTGNRK